MSAAHDSSALYIYVNRSGLRHDTGAGHPESPARLQAIIDLLGTPPYDSLPVIDSTPAALPWILRAHTQRHIDRIEDSIPDHGTAFLDGDTVISPHSYDAALDAAGAVCHAVQAVHDDLCTRAFCAVRPPGHHAEPDHAMGFCLFNNIFIGARYAQENCGLQKIAIVDFDVHHGNGTQSMARAADDILFISSHQSPFYPGTGAETDNIEDRILNVELAAGCDSATFRAAYEERVFPAIDRFSPDLIMISAGFDAHRDDPLAQMTLTEDDYAWVTGRLLALARRHCGGRIVSVLEGGYDLPSLKSCVAAHIDALQEKTRT